MRASSPSLPAAEAIDEAPISGVVALPPCELVSLPENDATSRELLEGRVRPSERRLALALVERFRRKLR